ncbi:MAG: tRNA (adenosine(37)-N6)-threonylcarbamoyltransferase complex transferase subunit TsaD, partial [bacterium]|nr:tRNA (adenosine(37)-N6)-threonylcarbamoyltransferase complex transferase subunit TsaD [bacterium]
KLAVKAEEIDAIAVTVGPGLAPALWAGVNFAQELADKLGKPLLGANHLEGHMYSILLPELEQEGTKELLKNLSFPAVGLIVSGGHTIILRMDSLQSFEKLGETRDDAAGEAFDKVAKILGFPYPGGPEIEKLAEAWDRKDIGLPRPMIDSNDLNFSFSGLKTAVLYHTRDNEYSDVSVAGNFQQAVIDILLKKTEKAVEQVGAQSIFFCGGVAANNAIRQALREKAEELGVSLLLPSEFVYNTDNAAMIAVAAYMAKLRGVTYEIEAQPNLNL